MTYTADSPLDGSPQASQEQAVAFLVKRGLDQATAATIVTAYWRYAPLAHLDPIVLIAQAVHETTNVKTGQPFGSWWAAPPRRNPAGIGVTGESRPHVADGAPDWQPMDNVRDYRGYAFGSWDAAVLAHVVHLAAYRYRDGAAVPGSIAQYFTARYDPRLPDVSDAGYRGIARVLRDLNGRWAKPGPTYGQSIAQVANEIVATPGGVPVTPTPTPTPGGTMLPKPPMVSNPAANRGGYSDPIAKQAVCWHITDGTNSLGWLTGTASGVSANYLIDRDGTIHELVPWTEAAWVQGISEAPDTSNPLIADWVARGVNFNTVGTGIECEGKSLCGQPGSLTAPQAGSLIALTAWLCQEQGHPCDRVHVIRHAQLQRYGRACCPGYDEATEMLPWIDQAARLLAGTTTLPGGTMSASAEDQNRQLLLAKVEAEVPVQYRGALTREGRFDASAFGGSANERVAVYEKLRCHTLSGSVVAFALAGDTSYDTLVAAGKVQLY